MENKKIKSVKRNRVEYIPAYGESRMWQSRKQMGDALIEWVHEDVILNCPLFEIEYEEEIPLAAGLDELKDELRKALTLIHKLCVTVPRT